MSTFRTFFRFVHVNSKSNDDVSSLQKLSTVNVKVIQLYYKVSLVRTKTARETSNKLNKHARY